MEEGKSEDHLFHVKKSYQRTTTYVGLWTVQLSRYHHQKTHMSGMLHDCTKEESKNMDKTFSPIENNSAHKLLRLVPT